MASILRSRAEAPPINYYDVCGNVNATCPVEATTLGYAPNLGASIFFVVGFGLLFVASVGLGIWKKTYSYAAAIALGLMLEALGHVGRALMNNNPWHNSAFQLQICTIILGPTFICVSIYLTLKHVTLALGPSMSRIPPNWYPLGFLPADLCCLVLQAAGGGVAAAAKPDEPKKLENGNRIIIAGIALQVVVLLIFGLMAADYLVKANKHMRSPEADENALRTWRNKKFRKFGAAVLAAYVAIFIRCVYRIAEMEGGWGNHIMQDEPSFLVLDSSLVLIASALLTIFHPGLLFPQMCGGPRRTEVDKETLELSHGVVDSSA